MYLDEEKVYEMLGRLDERTVLILEQTQKTNGRVTSLEGRVNDLESKLDTAAGAKEVKKTVLKIIWDVAKIVLPILIGFGLAIFGLKGG